MEIVSIEVNNMSMQGKNSQCIVHRVHVKIKDIESRASAMVAAISDTSWIANLGVVARASYGARSQRTIQKLVDLIVNRKDGVLTEEFGEFLISDTAQSALVTGFNHIKVPLAELFKEKVSGNPGFDFHTETDLNIIAFGEAKYSGSINPHSKAIDQIVKFIGLEKDINELVDLEKFVSSGAISNSLVGKKAFVAAFSVNGADPMRIIKNALKVASFNELLSFPEIYVIGVEIDA